ncbi:MULTISPECIES: response regulator [Deinococcus]|jgi:response regulator receiver protein|uniref:Response regulator n=1 Tax=Deinococcus radiodurans (strain ATCC 13939 / DSM 20539 / JCM 16871 / CCUG 27074 / LMG 4051 / NBRC 15346 / NCIMB 9279 / VKM B-1422 / R1) TaxID=243230 RepID=Q9RYV2_DEIRA|nr:response regulator [Deinococcus radiodurans]AAF12176.1 response regulator [Deinococcus radiodurans R1 = ATCC 13939 = DSM 20539]ANC73054.1 two-component system response regulator [Deinococcus radiodurans R1 = ATCC 13939 = DSM 20539]QEM73008.1 response regulator [Deinococcus radiodurans]QIP30311.1 response regulator [Deinococcus radiodurans]QIP33332.1 response regulator [Deinococcus radiodurans]
MRAIEILLTEDNPADILLTEEAFEEADFPHRLHVARDGVEALTFLRREENGELPTPDVILLDLNMPRLSGLELLDILKEDPQLQHIPVIVLTTSRAEEDVWRSYKLHANAYIPKPVSIGEFVEVIRSLGNFWFSVAALPSGPR